jgi:hypothetical protein
VCFSTALLIIVPDLLHTGPGTFSRCYISNTLAHLETVGRDLPTPLSMWPPGMAPSHYSTFKLTQLATANVKLQLFGSESGQVLVDIGIGQLFGSYMTAV